ncbi:hypothetical protein B484DRAFT_462392 [Ochromonadaceae sp. CCMP2298]|nr:hypothetical protein B484DRAFT_462392 [Ochromonadaceae sp. CCMP2298]
MPGLTEADSSGDESGGDGDAPPGQTPAVRRTWAATSTPDYALATYHADDLRWARDSSFRASPSSYEDDSVYFAPTTADSYIGPDGLTAYYSSEAIAEWLPDIDAPWEAQTLISLVPPTVPFTADDISVDSGHTRSTDDPDGMFDDGILTSSSESAIAHPPSEDEDADEASDESSDDEADDSTTVSESPDEGNSDHSNQNQPPPPPPPSAPMLLASHATLVCLRLRRARQLAQARKRRSWTQGALLTWTPNQRTGSPTSWAR